MSATYPPGGVPGHVAEAINRLGTGELYDIAMMLRIETSDLDDDAYDYVRTQIYTFLYDKEDGPALANHGEGPDRWYGRPHGRRRTP
jgi:hypothetical protein